MTKPSDFSPSKALEVKSGGDARHARRTRWLLRGLGVAILSVGWVVVSLHDFGGPYLVVDTVVFLAMALYAFAAAALSRTHAVNEERKLRLSLLVHNMELENMSIRDELTQLFNRRHLFDRLARELQTAMGFQRSLAYISLELRSLEHINSTYGFETGDRALAALGRFLMDYTRATDIPARVSGRRFGIILPDTSKRGAYTMIERLAQALSTASLTEDPHLDAVIVASFGVSGYPWGGETVDAVVRHAEAEMCSQTSGVTDPDGTEAGAPTGTDVPEAFRKVSEAARGP